MREVIRETIQLLQYELRQNRIVLTVDLPEKLPMVHGNRIQLEQVVLNLIINASEAMASSPDTARGLAVNARQSEDGILVSIRDSGIGLETGSIDKIFDTFFTTKPMGIGMGLAISRSIIQAQGGRIWATPNEGSGLTVQFTLPADDATP